MRFEGDLTLHSLLRVTGKWGVYSHGQRWRRSPHRAWLVIVTNPGSDWETLVYGHAGRACLRCGTRIRSRGQGDDNRTNYWCPSCQA